MLPKCSLIIYEYICINAFDYNAIIVYFTVLKPGTLYETWYYPSYMQHKFRCTCHETLAKKLVGSREHPGMLTCMGSCTVIGTCWQT